MCTNVSCYPSVSVTHLAATAVHLAALCRRAVQISSDPVLLQLDCVIRFALVPYGYTDLLLHSYGIRGIVYQDPTDA